MARGEPSSKAIDRTHTNTIHNFLACFEPRGEHMDAAAAAMVAGCIRAASGAAAARCRVVVRRQRSRPPPAVVVGPGNNGHAQRSIGRQEICGFNYWG
ncbi:hypothetical protein L596_022297 [Steinernema carpocapsae]|uniref:Uncharacterized protein n=1 Tax=Steinernema carpocapsae TaxID=34508 RepID=A0A4U5MLE9_STECR|nr:hypothetical protein L596_022297 [Steinernema carpocapsae]